jgi:glycosyltransferase involved in cell wall biosynthesis
MICTSYLRRLRFTPRIQAPIDPEVKLSVVIPSYNEPNLIQTLESLARNCVPANPVEVIVVFNHPVHEPRVRKAEHIERIRKVEQWAVQSDAFFNVFFIHALDLPSKNAGVGLARKIGMDEAVFRLQKHPHGVIVALDADCTVEPNYLKAVESHFKQHPDTPGASIYFEHRKHANPSLNRGIQEYELHLRYYKELIAFSGHPMGYHTVGSSMAVRVSAYCKQGGMNKRKAGEDFYFLQKIMLLGRFTSITSTIVYPSARESNRVPFGTGRAQGNWNELTGVYTYHPSLALVLQDFFLGVEHQFKEGSYPVFDTLHTSLQSFFAREEWLERMEEIQSNATTSKMKLQRFFSWFNLFMVMRFAHHYRDHFKPNVPVTEAAGRLLEWIHKGNSDMGLPQQLAVFRKIEQGSS